MTHGVLQALTHEVLSVKEFIKRAAASGAAHEERKYIKQSHTYLQLSTKKFIYNREFHLSDMHFHFFFPFLILFYKSANADKVYTP